jgi:hypothetical protein
MGATRPLRSLFVDIYSVDPWTLALACAGLAVVVVAASYLPRSARPRVDPIIALRQD